MSASIVHETDCATGETVVREMTDEEAAAHEAAQADAQARAAAHRAAARRRADDLALIAAHPDLPADFRAAVGRLLDS